MSVVCLSLSELVRFTQNVIVERLRQTQVFDLWQIVRRHLAADRFPAQAAERAGLVELFVQPLVKLREVLPQLNDSWCRQDVVAVGDRVR